MRIKPSTRKKEYLFSKIRIEARLLSSFTNVRELLKPYPGLKLVREGTSLLYEMKADEGDDRFFMLELDKESVAIAVHSKLTPMRFLQEAMLRLLGTMQTLSGCYEARLESLYPYLIMTIAGQQLETVLHQEKHEEETLPDVILSKRLIAMMKENASLREERDKAVKSFRKVVTKAVISASTSDHEMESIAARLGIDKKDLTASLDGMESAGYRVVRTGGDTFNLVRI